MWCRPPDAVKNESCSWFAGAGHLISDQAAYQTWIVWRAAASRASIVLLNQDWAIFPGNIGEQHYTPVLRGVCGGHVSTDCFKMKDTFSVGDTFKHTQNPAGSPKIVFSSVCPKGTAALHLMRTLCGWTGQHRNTGLLHVLMAPQEFACTIFKCI